MKKIIISIAAMMLWASCTVKDDDTKPDTDSSVEENKGDDQNGDKQNNDDGKIVIEPYSANTNYASEAEKKAAELVDNSIKETIDILRECQYPKSYNLAAAKYEKVPAREKLSDLNKEVYDSLYHCVLRYEDFYYDGSEYDQGKNQLTDKFFVSNCLTAYDALRDDYPELTQYFDIDLLKSSKSVIYSEWIKPGEKGMNTSTKESTKEYREVFDAAIDRIIKAMPANLCDFDKYRYLAIFVDVHNTYDKSHGTVGAYWPCYNLVINKTSVCSGYASAFQYLCRKAGLWCEIYEGTMDGDDHAWNRIMIDGKTYLCDCTFADSYSPKSGDWMKYFVQGQNERSSIGVYKDMDKNAFQTTGENGTDLWK